jgi:hypothetical protein
MQYIRCTVPLFLFSSGRGGLLYAATYLQDQLGWATPVIPRNLVTAVAQVRILFPHRAHSVDRSSLVGLKKNALYFLTCASFIKTLLFL